MSNEWWNESSAGFAHNFALASTGLHRGHEPEVRIEHVEQGVYRLGIDRESLALTAQDLLDIMDWCLLHARLLLSQVEQAKQEHEDTRTYMEHYYTGGD
jgi:hypothetical protein